jgi:hypothetical protein
MCNRLGCALHAAVHNRVGRHFLERRMMKREIGLRFTHQRLVADPVGVAALPVCRPRLRIYRRSIFVPWSTRFEEPIVLTDGQDSNVIPLSVARKQSWAG